MPTALSSVEVCNLALDLLRHRDVVTSIEDPESDTEAICSRWYDVTRRSVLRQFPWNFARKLTTLSRNSTDPAFGYADAYNLPGDYIQLVFVGEDIDEDYETDFSIQSGQILIDNNGSSALSVCYIYDCTDVAQFDPLFLDLFTAELAIRLANGLTGVNKSLKELLAWRDRLEGKARAKNGHENPPRVRYSSALQNRRKMRTYNTSDGTHLFPRS